MYYNISVESGISDFYFCSKRTNASNPPSIHSHIEFVFVLDGELSVTTDKNTHILKKGDTMIIMPYEVHDYKTEKFSEIFLIACPPDYMPEHKNMLTTKEFYPPVTKFQNTAELIINDIVNSEYKDDFKKKALLYCTLSEFVNNCKIIEKEAPEFDVYRGAIAYISKHFTENLTLEKVADYVGVTASHLSRVLNKGCKSSFPDILNSLRIYEAKRLLEQTDAAISSVAYEVGYGSIRNFNRIFKKYFGCNPRDINKHI